MDNPLKKEFEYYKDHQDELVDMHEGKFIVIKDREVRGVYDSEIEAYQEAQKQFSLGTFLIQKVEAGDASHTQTFYSRVSV